MKNNYYSIGYNDGMDNFVILSTLNNSIGWLSNDEVRLWGEYIRKIFKDAPSDLLIQERQDMPYSVHIDREE